MLDIAQKIKMHFMILNFGCNQDKARFLSKVYGCLNRVRSRQHLPGQVRCRVGTLALADIIINISISKYLYRYVSTDVRHHICADIMIITSYLNINCIGIIQMMCQPWFEVWCANFLHEQSVHVTNSASAITYT